MYYSKHFKLIYVSTYEYDSYDWNDTALISNILNENYWKLGGN